MRNRASPFKRCFKCLEFKPLNKFYKHPMMADGHLNKCKTCTRNDVRKNRRRRIDYYREYDRLRYRECPERRRATREQAERWQERNPEKRRAQAAVKRAVRAGKLVRPEHCEDCGASGLIHGHHPDYSKPLDVEWLCVPCHAARHREVMDDTA